MQTLKFSVHVCLYSISGTGFQPVVLLCAATCSLQDSLLKCLDGILPHVFQLFIPLQFVSDEVFQGFTGWNCVLLENIPHSS
jgi:hypothetical protein